jgi:hypothetical protein
MVGLPHFEAAEAGAVWRFRNEGNRASFVAHPDIYGPQFGGYDPIDLARGVTYAGNPWFWLIFICSAGKKTGTPLPPIPLASCGRRICAGRRWSRIWLSSARTPRRGHPRQ